MFMKSIIDLVSSLFSSRKSSEVEQCETVEDLGGDIPVKSRTLYLRDSLLGILVMWEGEHEQYSGSIRTRDITAEQLRRLLVSGNYFLSQYIERIPVSYDNNKHGTVIGLVDNLLRDGYVTRENNRISLTERTKVELY